jgi:hypothetical protein
MDRRNRWRRVPAKDEGRRRAGEKYSKEERGLQSDWPESGSAGKGGSERS